MSSTVGSRYRTGTVAATNAELTVRTVGFMPSKVVLTNETTRYRLEWSFGMTALTAFETTEAGAKTLEAAGGITALGPDSGGNSGFSVSARANMNDTTTEVIRWECWE